MNARQYLIAVGTKKAAITARAAGTSLGYLRCIAYDNRRPSPEMAKRLEEASDGLMGRADLRPDIWDANPKKGRPTAAAKKVAVGGKINKQKIRVA